MKSLVYSAVIIGPHSHVFFTASTSSADVTVSHLEIKHWCMLTPSDSDYWKGQQDN